MDQTPRRIDVSAASLPKPTQELFDKMGDAIRDVVECWVDDLAKRGVHLSDIEDVWPSAAASAYAVIARAGGGKVSEIKEDRH